MLTKLFFHITDNESKEEYCCQCYFSDILKALQFAQDLREDNKTVLCLSTRTASSYPKELDGQVKFLPSYRIR